MPQYAALYKTDFDVPVVRLRDAGAEVEVAIAPGIGNRAFEMKVRGRNILYFPFANLAEWTRDVSHLNGIPFLAPWANRLEREGFIVGERRYTFNGSLGTLRTDGKGFPIHGLLTASPHWEVVEAGSDSDSAYVTSRLEFWRYPDLMANWPFAHEYEMTYRLSEGVLEVRTVVSNLSRERMPVAIGFHPYFALPATRREDAFVRVPAKKHVDTDPNLLATGEFAAVTLPNPTPLRDHRFDDGYTDLIREEDGRAHFRVEAGNQAIDVAFGPRYQVGIIYAPPDQNYICFEPMSSITNGVNLAHAGKYSGLQWVAPGEKWQESFWIAYSETGDGSSVD